MFLSAAQSLLGFSRHLQRLPGAPLLTTHGVSPTCSTLVPPSSPGLLLPDRSWQAPGTLHSSWMALRGARGPLTGATAPTPQHKPLCISVILS